MKLCLQPAGCRLGGGNSPSSLPSLLSLVLLLVTATSPLLHNYGAHHIMVAHCTTQIIENLNPTSTVGYTVAATDTLFRVKNVDTTGGGDIWVDFPIDGVMASNLVIEIEDCDIAGALVFGHSQTSNHKQAHFVGASITIRNNNAGTLTFMYADVAGSQLTSTYSSSTTLNIQNNGFGDIRLFDSWNGAVNSATVSGGSTFSFHSSSAAGNYFRIAKTENSASATLTVTGAGSVFQIYGITRTAVSGTITVCLALNTGNSQLTVSAGGSFKMYQNSLYQMEVGRADPGATSTIEVLGEASTLELTSNTLSQTLMMCIEAAACTFSDNAVVSLSQNTVNILTLVAAGQDTATMTITRSTLSVIGNAVTYWLDVGAAQGTVGAVDITVTESSLMDISANTADVFRLSRSVSTSTLTFTVSKSAVIECRGNHITGTNTLMIMQNEASTTLAMTSGSRFNVAENSVPSAELAFIHVTSDSTAGVTFDTSSTIDISDNTVSKLRFGLVSGTSSTLTMTTSKSSAVEVLRNTIGLICSFAEVAGSGTVSMTVETAGIYRFEDNDAPSATCGYCPTGGSCTISLASSARQLGPS